MQSVNMKLCPLHIKGGGMVNMTYLLNTADIEDTKQTFVTYEPYM